MVVFDTDLRALDLLILSEEQRVPLDRLEIGQCVSDWREVFLPPATKAGEFSVSWNSALAFNPHHCRRHMAERRYSQLRWDLGPTDWTFLLLLPDRYRGFRILNAELPSWESLVVAYSSFGLGDDWYVWPTTAEGSVVLPHENFGPLYFEPFDRGLPS